MRNTFVLIGLLAIVGGCAAPGDLRKKQATLAVTSAKSSKVIAGCIADRWEAGGHRSLTSRPTANGYALSAESDLGLFGKDTGLVIDVADTKAGSSTTFYSNIALSSGVELVSRIVTECQK